MLTFVFITFAFVNFGNICICLCNICLFNLCIRILQNNLAIFACTNVKFYIRSTRANVKKRLTRPCLTHTHTHTHTQCLIFLSNEASPVCRNPVCRTTLCLILWFDSRQNWISVVVKLRYIDVLLNNTCAVVR